ncbi:MAG: SsrA-binding protein SmpB [Fimbriimonadales bacterium]|nr:SsrA-binding protein SmpB [Fimbriimonadales bacterium]
MGKRKADPKSDAGPARIQNRKAHFDYEILERYEAGLVLQGTEVKSLFKGRANLTDAYCEVREGEVWLREADIEPYDHATHFQHERRRERKLLLHKREIRLIARRSQEKGLTIVPLAVYFKHGKAKVEIALARGKRQYDKRRQIAQEDERRTREQIARGRLG